MAAEQSLCTRSPLRLQSITTNHASSASREPTRGHQQHAHNTSPQRRSGRPRRRVPQAGVAQPQGSYNDRTAIPVVEEAERRRDPKPRMTVMEATGRSIGTSLAFVCAAKGYPFRIASSSAFAREKLRSISAFGAIVYIIRSPPPS